MSTEKTEAPATPEQDTNTYYSPKKNGFFAGVLKGAFGIAWPDDAVVVTPEQHQTYIGTPPAGMALGAASDGSPSWVTVVETAPVTLSPDAQARQMSGWAQRFLDQTAQAAGYDNIAAAVSYVGDPNSVWAADGAALQRFRSTVWGIALPQINAVKAGSAVIPLKSVFLAALGTYTAPGAAPAPQAPAQAPAPVVAPTWAPAPPAPTAPTA
jgi:hypothetical protein